MSNSASKFFDPSAFNALGEEQRKAMTAAFDAMSNWRQELNSMQQKNSTAVFDKMASAAKTFGWPTEFVEMTRQQMQNVTKMQTQAIEQVMDVWEKQATSMPSAGGFEMPKFPGFGNMPSMPTFPGMGNFNPMNPFGIGTSGASSGTFPGMPDFSQIGSAPMMPMQLWMQAAEMWQKSWQQALTSWMETQNKMMDNMGGPAKR